MPAIKNKTVTVQVTKKDGTTKPYTFRFVPIACDENKPEELICETACPLQDVCNRIKNPNEMEDDISCFNDFCLSVGDKDKSAEQTLNDPDHENLMPVVEDVLKFLEDFDMDIYQEIIKTNPYVKLADVIDAVCGQDGYACAMYNPEHSNCTRKNGLCILKTLFKV